jgi:signal transduction histidine kinase
MKERALMMGGRLEMGNGETKGFRLAVTVPLPPVLSI